MGALCCLCLDCGPGGLISFVWFGLNTCMFCVSWFWEFGYIVLLGSGVLTRLFVEYSYIFINMCFCP